MPSPFPGMDPFLEKPAYWSDFHPRFINYWCEAIADALPAGYEASLGDRVYLVEHDPDERKLGYPDVAITNADGSREPNEPAGAVLLEPVTIPLTILEGPRETYIEILHQPDRSLVTAIELLSPANKEQPGRTEYLAKRRALFFQEVNLVELDLLLGGQRMPLDRPLPAGDYFYLVSRAGERPNWRVYSWTMRQRLPIMPIPLRAPDGDICIDLAAVFNTVYERARFGRRVDYAADLPPRLAPDDNAWARELLLGHRP